MAGTAGVSLKRILVEPLELCRYLGPESANRTFRMHAIFEEVL